MSRYVDDEVNGITNGMHIEESEKLKMSKKIVIHYSGWCEIDPEDVKFQCITNDEACGEPVITGKEWLELDEENRGCNYILESAVDVIRDSTDGEWTELEVTEDG